MSLANSVQRYTDAFFSLSYAFITICVRNLNASYSTLDYICSPRKKKKPDTTAQGGLNLILRHALQTGQLYQPWEVIICLHQLQRKPRHSHPIFKCTSWGRWILPEEVVSNPVKSGPVTGTLLGKAPGLNTRKKVTEVACADMAEIKVTT